MSQHKSDMPIDFEMPNRAEIADLSRESKILKMAERIADLNAMDGTEKHAKQFAIESLLLAEYLKDADKALHKKLLETASRMCGKYVVPGVHWTNILNDTTIECVRAHARQSLSTERIDRELAEKAVRKCYEMGNEIFGHLSRNILLDWRNLKVEFFDSPKQIWDRIYEAGPEIMEYHYVTFQMVYEYLHDEIIYAEHDSSRLNRLATRDGVRCRFSAREHMMNQYFDMVNEALMRCNRIAGDCERANYCKPFEEKYGSVCVVRPWDCWVPVRRMINDTRNNWITEAEQQCGYWYPFRDVCFISDRPIVCRDDAVVYADGTSQ